ncbi:hypothetical protein TRFO_29318 [Tritrichomonas foetus]|uniref:Ubiquitin-like domain-containing protein n=1 Tax=Tritrichomonas foetus TaxID=1144522 RepID=A0A1J4K0R1_9EUKA|nr:hypothetical protein TRFO_29318 [Tritrichomonas foetus]|eukprot:OHT03334.1 hypothetical protein TRFO_29318 [Tritrichomonas foetus]
MSSRTQQEQQFKFIDPTRHLFTAKLDPCLSKEQVKKRIDKYVDDYDYTKFSIEFGELRFNDMATLLFIEESRTKYDLGGYNYRIEIDNNSTAPVPFLFSFSETDKRSISFPLDVKISFIKQYLHDNNYPNCEDYDSIALFYNSNRELEGNITIRVVGIPIDEPIIVKNIPCSYNVILPDGTTRNFVMKKRDKVLQLKKLICQTSTNKVLKISDFHLNLDGNTLQDDSNLFYERIHETQFILVVMKHPIEKAIPSSHSKLPPNAKTPSSTKTSSSAKLQKKIFIKHPFNRRSTDLSNIMNNGLLVGPQGETYAQKEVISKFNNGEFRRRYSVRRTFRRNKFSITTLISFNYDDEMIAQELPDRCPVGLAKSELEKTLSDKITIDKKMIKIKMDNLDLDDDIILLATKLSEKPIYTIELDLTFIYRVKSIEIPKKFTFYPTYQQLYEDIKEDLLKIDPEYKHYRLRYQGVLLGTKAGITVLPGTAIDVEIIEAKSLKLDIFFQFPDEKPFSLGVKPEVTISEISRTIREQFTILDPIKLIFYGKILDPEHMLKDFNTALMKKTHPIVIYVQKSVKSVIREIEKHY